MKLRKEVTWIYAFHISLQHLRISPSAYFPVFPSSHPAIRCKNLFMLVDIGQTANGKK
jgi:hypothetical protein